jgi:hypothetical protein
VMLWNHGANPLTGEPRGGEVSGDEGREPFWAGRAVVGEPDLRPALRHIPRPLKLPLKSWMPCFQAGNGVAELPEGDLVGVLPFDQQVVPFVGEIRDHSLRAGPDDEVRPRRPVLVHRPGLKAGLRMWIETRREDRPRVRHGGVGMRANRRTRGPEPSETEW